MITFCAATGFMFAPFAGMQLTMEAEARSHQTKRTRHEQSDVGIGDTLVSVQRSRSLGVCASRRSNRQGRCFNVVSLVIRRQLLLRVALGLIVVDPELRMFLREDRRNLVHGLE